jgi:hypothetical protein
MIDFNIGNRSTRIGTSLFVKLDIPNTPLYLSDEDFARTIDGDVYNNLDSFISISVSRSDLRASRHELTLTISGIPVTANTAAFNDEAKGSEITVYRGFTEAGSRTLIEPPSRKFTGIVNNVGFKETWEPPNSTFTVVFHCINRLGLMQGRTAGRRTNDTDMKRFYPTDTSFKRVAQVKNANFNFGSPNHSPKYGVNY